MLIAPLHLLGLRLLRIPLKPLAKKVRAALKDQLDGPASPFDDEEQDESRMPFNPRNGPFNYERDGFPIGRLIKTVALLTTFIGAPAMAWYVRPREASFPYGIDPLFELGGLGTPPCL
jgi:hypothetical protein